MQGVFDSKKQRLAATALVEAADRVTRGDCTGGVIPVLPKVEWFDLVSVVEPRYDTRVRCP